MKTVAYDGVAAVTTDEVADALLELALTFARFNRYECVTVPVLIGVRAEQLTMMLGPTIHLSTVTGAAGDPGLVEGADDAAAALRRRTSEFVDPLRGLEAAAVVLMSAAESAP